MRNKLFTVRLSTDEYRRLERVARHHETSAAAVFRLLLKQEDDKLRDRIAPGRAKQKGH